MCNTHILDAGHTIVSENQKSKCSRTEQTLSSRIERPAFPYLGKGWCVGWWDAHTEYELHPWRAPTQANDAFHGHSESWAHN